MNEAESLMDEIVKRIPQTKEYNQYRNLLERLKAQPDLYRRVAEFRRRSVAIQLREGEDAIQQNNALQNEFRDLQNNGLSSEFFVAEHQYCRMIQNMQRKLLEGAQIETDFLEE